MNKKVFLWVVIGILFLVVLFLIFKVGASGHTIQSVSGATRSATSSNAMVGGC